MIQATIFQDLKAQFDELATDIPAHDVVMRRTAWNDYTNGALSGLLFQYTPSVDEEMPEDAFEYIAEIMGFHLFAGGELARDGYKLRVFVEGAVSAWEALSTLIEAGDTRITQLTRRDELEQLAELIE